MEPTKEELLEYIDYYQDILTGSHAEHGVTAQEISKDFEIDLDTTTRLLQMCKEQNLIYEFKNNEYRVN